MTPEEEAALRVVAAMPRAYVSWGVRLGECVWSEDSEHDARNVATAHGGQVVCAVVGPWVEPPEVDR